MTDDMYHAKTWLNRCYNKAKQLEADRRMLEIMQSRLGANVSKYDSDGTEAHDPEAAKARHDDALLDYSLQCNKVEKDAQSLSAEMTKTRRAIDELSDPAHQAVAIDRYINRFKWEDIAKLEHISIAQVFRVHSAMLERIAPILRHKNFI